MATKISYNAMSLPLGELLGALGDQVKLPDDQGHIQVQGLLDGYAILPSHDISREAFPWITGPVMAELYAESVPKGLFLAGADAVMYVPMAQVEKAKEAGAYAFVLLPAAGLTRASFYLSRGHRLELLAPDDAEADEGYKSGEQVWTGRFFEDDGSVIHKFHISAGVSISSLDLDLNQVLYNIHSSSDLDWLHGVRKEWLRSLWRIYKRRSANELWELSINLYDHGRGKDAYHYLEEFLGLAIVGHNPGGFLEVVPPDGWRREPRPGMCNQHSWNHYTGKGERVLEQGCDILPAGHDVFLAVHHDK